MDMFLGLPIINQCRRQVGLETPDYIIIVSVIAVFYILKWAAKKYFPDVDEKKRESIVYLIAFILMGVCMAIRFASK